MAKIPVRSMIPVRSISLLWLGVTLAMLAGQRWVAGQESTPEALNLYADAAGFQNGGQYDLAADEWESFLKRFPQDPLFQKAQHYAGVCRLQLKDYAKAAGHFEQVTKDAKFELVEDAYLNLAWCQYSIGRQGREDHFPKAVASFKTLIEKFPKGKYVDQGLFYLGESLYAQGKKAEAVTAYTKLVKAHPKSTLRCDALYALGVTLEETSEYAQAGTVYDQFVKECADNPLVTEVRMRKAETILQAGDLDEAARRFAEVAAVEGFAAADFATFRRAFCVAKQEDFAAAGAIYAKLVEDFPESAYVADARISAGRCYYRADQLDAAKQWLQAALDAGGANVGEATHWLCRIAISGGEFDQAAKLAVAALPRASESPFLVDLKLDEADALYEVPASRPAALTKYLQIVADHPDHRLAPQALYNAAFAAMDLKKFEDGLAHAGRFLERFPDDVLAPSAQSVAADCSLQLGDYADSEQRLRRLTKEHAEHEEANSWRVRLGLALYLQKKYADVIAGLTPALAEITAANLVAEANFLIGGSRYFEKQYEAAETALAASLEAKPDWRKADEVTLLLSRSQRARGELELARSTVERALADFPESRLRAELQYRLGEYAYAAEDYEAAAQAYAKVSESWPDSPFSPFALYGKGWSHLKALQYPLGATEFGKLIDQHPEHQLLTDAHFGRAMCLRQLSKYKPAIADIGIYLKSDLDAADRANALYERGQCEAGLKQYEAAVATFEDLLKKHPEYPNAGGVLYEIGWGLKNSDKHDEAARAFARLAADHGDSPFAAEANYHVGEMKYGEKDFPAAVKAYAASKAEADVPELLEQATHKLGWSYYRLGDYEKSLAEFQQQLQKSPAGRLAADAAFMRAECMFKAEDQASALTAFQEALKTPPRSETMLVLLHLHGAQSAAQLENWPEAEAFLEPVPEKYPQTPLLAEVLFERGRARQNLDRLDQALEDFGRAASLSRTAVGARSRFMIGEIEFQKKQYETAVSTFRKVMYGYGGDRAIDEIKPWQAVAGFEAGRCAESQIAAAAGQARASLIENAKQFYTFVIEKHPTNEYAAKAKQRLADLAKLAD